MTKSEWDHITKSIKDNLDQHEKKMEEAGLSEYEKSIICMIEHDVKDAVASHDKNDIKAALESVKRIKQSNGELNLAIMNILKTDYNMKFVWGTVDEATHKEKRLALVYNGMAFQID